MQFHVPQFIDVEDKIFGPLTFKQFVYLAGGVGLCVVVYALIPIAIISWPLMALIVGFSLALAFYQVNNKPFISLLQAAFQYITNPRLFLWKHQTHSEKSQARSKAEEKQIKKLISNVSGEKARRDRLRDISFAVDVGNNTKNVEKDPVHTSPNRSAS